MYRSDHRDGRSVTAGAFSLGPPLTATRDGIDRVFEILRTTLRQTG